jgi:hypothetical protein
MSEIFSKEGIGVLSLTDNKNLQMLLQHLFGKHHLGNYWICFDNPTAKAVGFLSGERPQSISV